jgi:hypothetical protein
VAATTRHPDEYSIGRVFKNTWDYYKNAFMVNFLATLLPAIALIPVFIDFFRIVSDKAKLPASAFGQIALLELILFIILWYMMAFITTVYDRRGLGERWERPGMGDIFVSSLTGFLRMFVLVLIYMGCFIVIMIPFVIIAAATAKTGAIGVIVTLITYLAMLTLIVYLMLIYGPSMTIAILEPKIIKALKESARMTKGKRLKMLLTYLLAIAVVFGAEIAVIIPVGITAALAAKAGTTAVGIMAAVGVFLFVIFVAMAMPLGYAYYYSIYNEAKTTAR